MNTFTITLTDAELKALSFVCYDPQVWIDNAVHERCRLAMNEIFEQEVARMTSDPSISEIPADIETVVLNAEIESAKDRSDNQSQPLEA